MTFAEFLESVRRTCRSGLSERDATLNASLGLGGEAGEVVDLIKKREFHGKNVDRELVALELGDVLFYVAWLADLHGYTLEEIANKNSAKLRARWPNGFVPEVSL